MRIEKGTRLVLQYEQWKAINRDCSHMHMHERKSGYDSFKIYVFHKGDLQDIRNAML